MATKTVKLYARTYGLTNRSDPATVQSLPSDNQVSLIASRYRLYVGFDAFSSSLNKKRLYSVKACFCMNSSYQAWLRGYLRPAASGFNASTLTWSNQPAGSGSALDSGQMSSSLVDRELTPTVQTTAQLSQQAADFVRASTGYFDNSNLYDFVHVKIRSLEDGSSLPYLEVTYDDSTDVTSQIVSTTPAGSLNPANAKNFTWEYQNSGDYSRVAPFVQASATLYWRKSGTSTWNSVPVSGSALNVNVPSYTFPTNATIEWYLSGTDTDGHTSTTTTSTFTTQSTQIVVDQAPSGSNIYPGSAITFAWHYQLSGGATYPSGTTKIYWKKDTENDYHEITVPGTPSSYRVPANTFPTNATVQWYLSGTDSGGGASQTSVASFKTLTSKITPQNSPTSGYTDPRNAITFSWYFSTNGGSVAQGSASLYWKVSTAENYTQIAASGSTTQVTVAANTFPVASTIQWYIAGTDYSGTSSQSSVYSFSTAAGTANAILQSPIGKAEDGTQPITFEWILTNSDGSDPIEVVLSWKTPEESESSWHVIEDSNTPITSWTVAANYFSIGEIEWRVIATNRDGVAGPAAVAAFICMRSPDPPSGLRATAVPRTTVTWQSSNQEAFEIKINGEIVEQAYGPGVNSWQAPEPLPDGIYDISVRIQGQYGYWSAESTTSISVENEPPVAWGEMTLAGRFFTDAALSISGDDLPADPAVQWYRDGKRIAQTEAEESYTDRMALGTHEWYAEIWSDDGNYLRSNTVNGSPSVPCPVIGLKAGGDWLQLALSENKTRTEQFRHTRTSSLRHVSGTVYPVLETSRFEDRSGSFDCAFRCKDQAAAFEQLFGQVVILKNRSNDVTVGLLAELEKNTNIFYISYRFSISQIAQEGLENG